MVVNYDSFKAVLKANNAKLAELMDSKDAEIKTLTIKKVDSLPEAGEAKTLYLVPKVEDGVDKNTCVEYLYIDGAFEIIGDTTVDLSDYYTKEEVDAAVADKADASDVYAPAHKDVLEKLTEAEDGTLQYDGSPVSAGADLSDYAKTSEVTEAIEAAAYELPVATTDVLGGVKVDGTTVTVTEDGTISAVVPEVDLDGYYTKSEVDEAIAAVTTEEYVLPAATTDTLGGVKVDGTTVTVTDEGVISAVIPESEDYVLPEATAETLGGVKVDGTTITAVGGVISAVAPQDLSDEEVTDLINEIWA